MNAQELRQITDRTRPNAGPEPPSVGYSLPSSIPGLLANLIRAEARRAAQLSKDAIYVNLADFPYCAIPLPETNAPDPLLVLDAVYRELRKQGLKTAFYLAETMEGKGPCDYVLRVSW